MSEPARTHDATVPTTEVAGHTIVSHYSGAAAEYAALRSAAVVVDRSHRGRMRFTGEKAAEILTGLVTNDVNAVQPGHGQYAAALTAKGKVVADVRIFAEQPRDGVPVWLVDTPPRAWPGWVALVRKFVNPRLARWTDVSSELRTVGVYGPEARRVVGSLVGMSESGVGVLPHYSHARAGFHGTPVLVARIPDLGVDGYDLFVPAELHDALFDAAMAAGATPAGLEACEIARVEAGRPEWGLDMDDATLAQEANLEELNAISYTKGCYVGQEVVARIHFRGHVNRLLRGIQATDGTDSLPSGAHLFDADMRDVGDVRTAVVSPRLGPIAIAMIRREVEPGTTLTARSADADRTATVAVLPFPAE